MAVSVFLSLSKSTKVLVCSLIDSTEGGACVPFSRQMGQSVVGRIIGCAVQAASYISSSMLFAQYLA